ncbi:MAG TPA: PGPGW domain-containing protein [Planctomycetota bacterium]|nr:PGPGW domain-containing protein [Planctomycetota bacterium]
MDPVLWIVALSVGTFILSLVFVGLFVVLIPADYFAGPRRPKSATPARWILRIFKNLLGLVLVALGIVMAMPLVPGQGLLTILIGLTLLDFPGKWRMERLIILRPRVLGAINRLRARYRRPPIVTPPEGMSPAE